MNKSFEFYFDFISPYSFIAHKEIRKYEKKNLLKVINGEASVSKISDEISDLIVGIKG